MQVNWEPEACRALRTLLSASLNFTDRMFTAAWGWTTLPSGSAGTKNSDRRATSKFLFTVKSQGCGQSRKPSNSPVMQGT